MSLTTNGMNHPTGLYINRQIWHKTKPSKPYTSFIFKIIWNVTSDSRMNQKNLSYLKQNIAAHLTLTQKFYASKLSKFLYKHKKHLLVTKYTQETHAHAHTHTQIQMPMLYPPICQPPNPRDQSRFTTIWKWCFL